MRALMVAVLYFGTFLTIGLMAKLAINRWMARHGADLEDVQAGENRRTRKLFLQGAWRNEPEP